MKTLRFDGPCIDWKLLDELQAAGVPATGVDRVEDFAVAREEPVLDPDTFEFVLKDGKPETVLRWYKDDAEIELDADGIHGTHWELSPGWTLVYVPDGTDEKKARAVFDAHDPTPPPQAPSLEDRIARLEAQLDL